MTNTNQFGLIENLVTPRFKPVPLDYQNKVESPIQDTRDYVTLQRLHHTKYFAISERPTRRITINPHYFMNYNVLNDLKTGKSAKNIMDNKQRMVYTELAPIFDYFSEEMLKNFLKASGKNATEGFCKLMKEWFKLIIVNTFIQIEI